MKANLVLEKLTFDKSQYQTCFSGSHVPKKYLGKRMIISKTTIVFPFANHSCESTPYLTMHNYLWQRVLFIRFFLHKKFIFQVLTCNNN